MSQYLDGSEPSAAIHCTQCQASVAAHLTENGDEYVGRCDHCGTNNVITVRAPANRVGGESIVAKREPVSNVTEKIGPIPDADPEVEAEPPIFVPPEDAFTNQSSSSGSDEEDPE